MTKKGDIVFRLVMTLAIIATICWITFVTCIVIQVSKHGLKSIINQIWEGENK